MFKLIYYKIYLNPLSTFGNKIVFKNATHFRKEMKLIEMKLTWS